MPLLRRRRRRRVPRLLIVAAAGAAIGAFRNRKIEENQQRFNLP